MPGIVTGWFAKTRLAEERKEWRKGHPFGFVALPTKGSDGNPYYLRWICYIPGKKSTPWEEGLYKLQMIFKNTYPATPPRCMFDPPLFHPNISRSGLVCFPLLDEEKDWKSTVNIKKILLGIQELLDNPNISYVVNSDAYRIYCNHRLEYVASIHAQARANVPTNR